MSNAERTKAIAERVSYFGRARLPELFNDEFAQKLQRVIDEGLAAKSVKVFQYEGSVVVDEERIDYDARHKYAELASKLLDWHPSKIEHEVHGEVGITIIGFDQDGV